MFKNLLLVLALLFVLISASKADLPDTVWCKYTYPTQINAVKFTPDGKYLASGGSDGVVNIWDVATGAFIKDYFHSSFAVTDIDINGNFIAIACSGNMKVYSLTTDSMLFNGIATRVKFSKDGNYLLTNMGTDIKKFGMTVIDTKSWSILKSIEFPEEAFSIAFSPDNKFIAKSDYWNMNIKDSIASVQIFNFPDLTYYKTLITKSYLSISQLVFSDINQYLAGALGSDGDKIWNTSDWGLFRNFNQGEDQYSVAFDINQNYIITGGGIPLNKHVKIWNINTGELIYTYPKSNTPNSLDVSSDNKYIAASLMSSGIIIFNAKWNPASVANNPIQITNPIIFPNPTNGTANIQFSLLKPELINIKIYDSASNLVSSVFNGQLQQGMQNIPWNALSVASGVYYARITAAGQVSTIQIIVNK